MLSAGGVAAAAGGGGGVPGSAYNGAGTVLNPPQGIAAGAAVLSPNGGFRLILQVG
jgi:hypothetical protein